MHRIAIVGTSCAGKSTLAKELSRILDVPHIELDEMYWGKDWSPAPTELFRQQVAQAVQSPGWVCDGNYRDAREFVWNQLDTIIWLNYSLPVMFWRGVKRSLKRSLWQQHCCNGNRESLKRTFSKDSILLWILTSYRRRRREFAAQLPSFEQQGKRLVILTSPAETKRWLVQLASNASPKDTPQPNG